MPRRKNDRPPLLVRVLVELGKGRIHEAQLVDKDHFVDGWIEGGHITINPVDNLVDTLIHELLHRLHPEWSESYVKGRTTYLMRRMTAEEIKAVYEEYCNRVRVRSVPGTRTRVRSIEAKDAE